MLKLKKGDTFSREKLTESTKLIVDRLGDDGYAFANVNPVPEVDRTKKQVAFTLYVDPGRRVYVRRINVSGNTTTRDEVIRREMRQLEGGWYSTEKLKRSKVRIDKLGFFSEVNVDTVNVPGSPDQVDVEVKVVERPTAICCSVSAIPRLKSDSVGIGIAVEPVRHRQRRVAAAQQRQHQQGLCALVHQSVFHRRRREPRLGYL
jgi:outer membrane protein assembly complex protein YaeT